MWSKTTIKPNDLDVSVNFNIFILFVIDRLHLLMNLMYLCGGKLVKLL